MFVNPGLRLFCVQVRWYICYQNGSQFWFLTTLPISNNYLVVKAFKMSILFAQSRSETIF